MIWKLTNNLSLRGSFTKPDDQASEIKTLDFRRPPSAAGLGN
jgi:hypothetical protein